MGQYTSLSSVPGVKAVHNKDRAQSGQVGALSSEEGTRQRGSPAAHGTDSEGALLQLWAWELLTPSRGGTETELDQAEQEELVGRRV